MDFETRLVEVAAAVQKEIEQCLALEPREKAGLGCGAEYVPLRLRSALRSAALCGGKRLRAFFLLETERLFLSLGRERNPSLPFSVSHHLGWTYGALRAAAAVELIHSYSLVHDDLPIMDDGILRRGKPCLHLQFDEATALLAGDALLGYGFEMLLTPEIHPDPSLRLTLLQDLAHAVGPYGMVGGQSLDLEAENTELALEDIYRIQSMKTGALLSACCRLGALLAQAAEEDLERMTRFGLILGQAFQVADDLLDAQSSSAVLGKATQQDAKRGKATLSALKGEQWTQNYLESLIEEAQALLIPYHPHAFLLEQAAAFAGRRKF